MASCVRNICTKNYQILIIVFKVTVKNVDDVFLRHSVVILSQMLAASAEFENVNQAKFGYSQISEILIQIRILLVQRVSE